MRPLALAEKRSSSATKPRPRSCRRMEKSSSARGGLIRSIRGRCCFAGGELALSKGPKLIVGAQNTNKSVQVLRLNAKGPIAKTFPPLTTADPRTTTFVSVNNIRAASDGKIVVFATNAPFNDGDPNN